MARYFGFNPTDSEKGYVFVSYNSEDADRVASVLADPAGGPIYRDFDVWYDAGIAYDEKWEKVLFGRIKRCSVFLQFVTKGMAAKEGSWAVREEEMARRLDRPTVYVVMDSLSLADSSEDNGAWLNNVFNRQGVMCAGMDSGKTAMLVRQALEALLPSQSLTDIGTNASDERSNARRDAAAKTQSFFEAAVAYLTGVGRPQNSFQAAYYARLAADKGHSGAAMLLASMYENGNGVPKDLEKAQEYRCRVPVENNPDSLYRLGKQYDLGEGVAPDTEKAFSLYRLAADLGCVGAQRELGLRYRSGMGVQRDYDSALRYYQMAVAQGDAEAQYGLGTMYHDGRGVEKDRVEAARLFRLAADQGEPLAQCQLGEEYLSGTVVPQDYAVAASLFKLASDQHHPRAQYNLGKLYLSGRGVPQSNAEAERLFELALNGGVRAARIELDRLAEEKAKACEVGVRDGGMVAQVDLEFELEEPTAQSDSDEPIDPVTDSCHAVTSSDDKPSLEVALPPSFKPNAKKDGSVKTLPSELLAQVHEEIDRIVRNGALSLEEQIQGILEAERSAIRFYEVNTKKKSLLEKLSDKLRAGKTLPAQSFKASMELYAFSSCMRAVAAGGVVSAQTLVGVGSLMSEMSAVNRSFPSMKSLEARLGDAIAVAGRCGRIERSVPFGSTNVKELSQALEELLEKGDYILAQEMCVEVMNRSDQTHRTLLIWKAIVYAENLIWNNGYDYHAIRGSVEKTVNTARQRMSSADQYVEYLMESYFKTANIFLRYMSSTLISVSGKQTKADSTLLGTYAGYLNSINLIFASVLIGQMRVVQFSGRLSPQVAAMLGQTALAMLPSMQEVRCQSPLEQDVEAARNIIEDLKAIAANSPQ